MPIQVLHIEDNAGDAILLRTLLTASSGQDFNLTHAIRLSAAFELLEKTTFDVLLLDLSLPDSFGIITFQRIREKYPQIPVIVLSGLDDEAAAMTTVQAGAQDYLCKDELNERMLPRAIRYAIERHRGDERVDEERRLLRSLIDALPDQIYVKDCQSKFVSCNNAVMKHLNVDKMEAIVGKSDYDFFPQSLADTFFKEEIAVLSGTPCVNREELVASEGSEPRWLLTTKVPLYDRNGMVYGLVGINRDITDRKRAEDQLVQLLTDLNKSHDDLKAAQMHLIQAEKMESVGRIAAGVAHEVKNPLAVAVMGLDYLKNTLGAAQPSMAPVLNEIYDAIQRADTVIGGLLDFSRPRTLILSQNNINDLVQESLPLIRHDLTRKHIQLKQHFTEDLPRIGLDENKIKQVFLNLLMNAIHATPESGELTITTYWSTVHFLRDEGVVVPPARFGDEDKLIAVRIADSGSGILDEHMTKIFDPYFTTKAVGEGTGLGLSVSRQIVELHGGVLDLRNRQNSAGARAILALRAH